MIGNRGSCVYSSGNMSPANGMQPPLSKDGNQCESKAESVFLTPPPSVESTIPNKCISRINHIHDTYWNKIKFEFTDEEEEEEIDSSIKVDFMSEFNNRFLIGTVCSKILGRLSDKELLRASHVSKTWRTVIRYMDMKSSRRLARYIRKMKASYGLEKENRNRDSFQTFLNEKLPLRTPLNDKSRIMNKKIDNIADDEHQATTPISIPLASSKELYKQCPQCQSPSRTFFKQTGYCSKCNDNFCVHCFYTNDKHSPSCRIVGGCGVSSSPRKPLNSPRKYTIGSKENKFRLKRL